MNKHPLAFWSLSTTAMLQQLQAAKEGLTAGEAGERLRRHCDGVHYFRGNGEGDFLQKGEMNCAS
jgi:hypothetical protein